MNPEDNQDVDDDDRVNDHIDRNYDEIDDDEMDDDEDVDDTSHQHDGSSVDSDTASSDDDSLSAPSVLDSSDSEDERLAEGKEGRNYTTVCRWDANSAIDRNNFHQDDLKAMGDILTNTLGKRCKILDQDPDNGRITSITILDRNLTPDERPLVIPSSVTLLSKLTDIEIKTQCEAQRKDKYDQASRPVVIPAEMAGMSNLNVINFSGHIFYGEDRDGAESGFPLLSVTQGEGEDSPIEGASLNSMGNDKEDDPDEPDIVDRHQRTDIIFPHIRLLNFDFLEFDDHMLRFVSQQCPNLFILHCKKCNSVDIVNYVHRSAQSEEGSIALTHLHVLHLDDLDGYGVSTLVCDVVPKLPSLQFLELNGFFENEELYTLQVLSERMISMASLSTPPSQWSKLLVLEIMRTEVWKYFAVFFDPKSDNCFYFVEETDEEVERQSQIEMNSLATILELTGIEALVCTDSWGRLKSGDEDKYTIEAVDEHYNRTMQFKWRKDVKFYLQRNHAHRKITEKRNRNEEWTDIFGWAATEFGPDILYRLVRKSPLLVGRSHKRLPLSTWQSHVPQSGSKRKLQAYSLN